MNAPATLPIPDFLPEDGLGADAALAVIQRRELHEKEKIPPNGRVSFILPMVVIAEKAVLSTAERLVRPQV